MKEIRNSLLASNLNKIKESALKGVNSFYFRATLFLLGLGVFLPLPMCIGLPFSNSFSMHITNKRLQSDLQPLSPFLHKLANVHL